MSQKSGTVNFKLAVQANNSELAQATHIASQPAWVAVFLLSWDKSYQVSSLEGKPGTRLGQN